jgi:hypothetical protein
VRRIPIVVVGSGHDTRASLLLANGPVLDVVIAPVYEPDIIGAAVADEGALMLAAAGARVVCTKVLCGR